MSFFLNIQVPVAVSQSTKVPMPLRRLSNSIETSQHGRQLICSFCKEEFFILRRLNKFKAHTGNSCLTWTWCNLISALPKMIEVRWVARSGYGFLCNGIPLYEDRCLIIANYDRGIDGGGRSRSSIQNRDCHPWGCDRWRLNPGVLYAHLVG